MFQPENVEEFVYSSFPWRNFRLPSSVCLSIYMSIFSFLFNPNLYHYNRFILVFFLFLCYAYFNLFNFSFELSFLFFLDIELFLAETEFLWPNFVNSKNYFNLMHFFLFTTSLKFFVYFYLNFLTSLKNESIKINFLSTLNTFRLKLVFSFLKMFPPKKLSFFAA